MNKSCEHCSFFIVDEDNPREGECRRFPPQMIVIIGRDQITQAPKPQIRGAFPRMDATDPGCGEYDPHEEWKDSIED